MRVSQDSRNKLSRHIVILSAVAAVFFALTVLSLTQTARADEGMWLPHELSKAPFEAWQQRGLMLDMKEIYDPKGKDLCSAIIQLGGGTASFVSFDGLIATNHHVAFGALQRSSTESSDYIEKGFLARTRGDEIHAKGYEALVQLDVKDVTKKVLKGVKEKMSDLERYKVVEKNTKKIVEKAEKGKDVEVRVRGFFGGLQYLQFTYFKIKDIRIVYAPPLSIGEYGGDIDNWMWPRHTGDFSFMRAYVAPDGKSAEFNEGNVPYRPKNYLTISKGPLKEGDFTMVIGYPGQTRRYRSSFSINYFVNKHYPFSIELFEDILSIIGEESAKSRDAAIKLASLDKGLNNALKNYYGMQEGLKKANLLAKKQKEEKALMTFLDANPKLKKKFGHVLSEMETAYDDNLSYYDKSTLGNWLGRGVSAMGSAYLLYKWSKEREKKDIDRDPGFMDRDQPRINQALEYADLRYHEPADRALFKYFLKRVADLPEGQRLETFEDVIGGKTGDELDTAIDAFLSSLYSGTKVTNKDERMKMFGMKLDDLLALDDPFINMVAKSDAEREKLEELDEIFGGRIQKLRPQLMEMRMEYKGSLMYPDANGTMRISAGSVKGYSPGDAVHYEPFTTLGGVVEKHTGEEPFDAPQALLDLHAAKDFGDYTAAGLDDVPVCFLSTNDGTGGNSGSPIVNGKGELIGLLFDGNYESISADYHIIPKLNRSINVDSRYVLFVLDKFADAKELMRELKIK